MTVWTFLIEELWEHPVGGTFFIDKLKISRKDKKALEKKWLRMSARAQKIEKSRWLLREIKGDRGGPS